MNIADKRRQAMQLFRQNLADQGLWKHVPAYLVFRAESAGADMIFVPMMNEPLRADRYRQKLGHFPYSGNIVSVQTLTTRSGCGWLVNTDHKQRNMHTPLNENDAFCVSTDPDLNNPMRPATCAELLLVEAYTGL